MKPSSRTRRFAAKLLFQFRLERGRRSNRRRICEERIVVLHATSAAKALRMAKRRGAVSELEYPRGNATMHVEFVGVTDLLRLGVESEPDEVWWQLSVRESPMERKRRLVPGDPELLRRGS